VLVEKEGEDERLEVAPIEVFKEVVEVDKKVESRRISTI
jgi:hypothetical protein